MKTIKKIIVWLIFLLYVSILGYMLFFQYRSGGSSLTDIPSYAKDHTNLIPFGTIKNYWKLMTSNGLGMIFNHAFSFYNLMGNIALFIPMGFLLPILFKKLRVFKKCVWISFIILLCIEILQLFTMRGSFDVDDIILNMLGILTCILIYHLPGFN